MLSAEDMCPLFVGYSAFVDESVIRHSREAGFDLVLETPLSVPKIKDTVIG